MVNTEMPVQNNPVTKKKKRKGMWSICAPTIYTCGVICCIWMPKFFLVIGIVMTFLGVLITILSNVPSLNWSEGEKTGILLLIFGILLIVISTIGLFIKKKLRDKPSDDDFTDIVIQSPMRSADRNEVLRRRSISEVSIDSRSKSSLSMISNSASTSSLIKSQDNNKKVQNSNETKIQSNDLSTSSKPSVLGSMLKKNENSTPKVNNEINSTRLNHIYQKNSSNIPDVIVEVHSQEESPTPTAISSILQDGSTNDTTDDLFEKSGLHPFMGGDCIDEILSKSPHASPRITPRRQFNIRADTLDVE